MKRLLVKIVSMIGLTVGVTSVSVALLRKGIFVFKGRINNVNELTREILVISESGRQRTFTVDPDTFLELKEGLDVFILHKANSNQAKSLRIASIQNSQLN